jgi:hypothetical protein
VRSIASSMIKRSNTERERSQKNHSEIRSTSGSCQKKFKNKLSNLYENKSVILKNQIKKKFKPRSALSSNHINTNNIKKINFITLKNFLK